MTVDTPEIKNIEGENIIKLSDVYAGEIMPGYLQIRTQAAPLGVVVAQIDFTMTSDPQSAQITVSDWSQITSDSTLYVAFEPK